MKGLRFLDRRVGFSMGALTLLAGMVAPAVLPAFASASQITSRSIQMSNSQEGATGVTYTLTFTPDSAHTGALDMIIYFCSNSPLIGASCTAPTGMDVSGATVSAGSGSPVKDATDTGNPTTNVIAINTLSLQSGANTITLGNVTNPTSVDNNGTFYARIETFDTNAHQESVWSDATGGASQHGAELGSPTGLDDNGSVATAATNQIGVNAAVLETLTFCTYGDPNNALSGTVGSSDSSSYLSGLADATNGPKGDCTNTNSNIDPTNITLGEQAATGVLALSTTTPSYAAGWTGISTNASGGAIVYMKNNSPCDGLVLNGGSTCGIPETASGNHGIGTTFPAAGTAAYGLTFGGGASHGAFAAPGSTATGSIDINTNYAGNYSFINNTATLSASQANGAEDNLTQDIDSTYGGFVYGTEGAPATNQDVPFGIAAGIAANTAAGRYTSNLSLIAVGTF